MGRRQSGGRGVVEMAGRPYALSVTRFVIQPHVRLQEWVAEELGLFEAEGLDYACQTHALSARSLSTSAVRTTAPARFEESVLV